MRSKKKKKNKEFRATDELQTVDEINAMPHRVHHVIANSKDLFVQIEIEADGNEAESPSVKFGDPSDGDPTVSTHFDSMEQSMGEKEKDYEGRDHESAEESSYVDSSSENEEKGMANSINQSITPYPQIETVCQQMNEIVKKGRSISKRHPTQTKQIQHFKSSFDKREMKR